jgi:transposase
VSRWPPSHWANGLNANLLRRWVAERERWSTAAPAQVACGVAMPAIPTAGFVPVKVPVSAERIRIELRRGATVVTVNWPMAAAAECAAWVRELLR